MKSPARSIALSLMDDDSNRAGLSLAADNTDDSPAPKSSLWQWLKRAFGEKPESLKEALEEVIEEHEEQTDEQLQPQEKVMLHNVLSFSDIKVSDIMIPRVDINAVPIDITLDGLRSYIMLHRHTRIPVYEDTLDKVKGFI